MKTFSLAVWVLAMAVSALNAQVHNGQVAPDFTLKSSSGADVALSQYEGSIIVLEWFNHNCPFVHKFYDSGKMQAWQQFATARGVVWLTIDSTNPAHRDHMNVPQAAAVYEDFHMHSTALLLDPDGHVGHAYGAVTTPQIFVISREGNVVYQGSIDDVRTSDSSDIGKGDNHLLNALESVLAGNTPIVTSARPYGCSVKYATE